MITNTFAVRSIVERNIIFFRRDWVILVAGMFEPIFWLVGISAGLSTIIDDVEFRGELVEYTAFVAPGLIAVSAMNGAAFDATFNFYFKLKELKIFDSIITTPVTIGNVVVGEAVWSVLRSTVYAVAFLVLTVLFGLVTSWWAFLIIPIAALIGFAVSAIGIFATTFVRNWHDFDYFSLVLQVLFIGSATFYPITVYPGWVQVIVQFTPLYHGVALCRSLALGAPNLADLGHLSVLLAFTAAFGWLANRRLAKSLLA
jgi:lipooligosaccharide transport system permease protein